MTRSSKPVREHILDFDDDFERTLRKQKTQQNPNPPASSSTSEFDEGGEEGEATTQFVEEVQTMAVDNRTIKELSASGMDNVVPLCIQYPTAAQGKTDEFEQKSSLLHHIPKFHGLSMEDPNKHLKEFEVVCSSMTPINVDESIMKMKAFPFSLVDKAKDWLFELAPGTVNSWENASAGGALVDKTPVDAKTLIANQAHNAQQYEGVGQREGPRQQSVNEGQEKQAKDMHNYANEVQNQAREVTELKRQVGQMAEFMGQFSREQGKNVLSSVPTNVFPSNVPFPSTFMQTKKEEAERDILETFRKVQVNIPLLDAIKQVPRSNAYPKGVLEDVLVQVNHLVFPADFYVLEMDESDHTPSLPILLGRPFMKTARTKIDVYNGTLTMEFDGEVINFNLSDFMKYPSENC
ncbi:uncharacterized protein [Pyrus communis]|uniref:uncharacterized protein n=1 Tax=Pyrus communis TaxID=23211 RepID=UPI0035C13A14